MTVTSTNTIWHIYDTHPQSQCYLFLPGQSDGLYMPQCKAHANPPGTAPPAINFEIRYLIQCYKNRKVPGHKNMNRKGRI